MKAFFDKFSSLKSASFIGLEGYENSYGEISNLSVLVNVDTKTAKEKDLATLKAVTDADLKDIANSKNLPMDTLKVALSELITSAEKNLSENPEERTAQSKAQTDAYLHLTPAVKLHKETLNVYVTGLVNHKTVIIKGEYPTVKKREKTLCKDAIKKHCDLRMEKYRTYNIGSMEKINITGSTLQLIKG